MSLHIIIDGYNLIRQSAGLSKLDRVDIQDGREALVNWLAVYKRIRSHKITVVFDGSNAPALSSRRGLTKGIAIRFSRKGELADTVIKRMARQEKEQALVVSSDREIVKAAASHGAATISSPEFEEKLLMAESTHNSGFAPDTAKKSPGRNAPPKKRGLTGAFPRKCDATNSKSASFESIRLLVAFPMQNA